MARSKGGESSKGLIVTLVFFILATIILGVTTYTGYDAVAAKEATAKQERDKATKEREHGEFYEFCYLYTKGALGLPLTPDQQGSFSTARYNEFTGSKFNSEKEKEEVDKFVARLNQELGFNDAEKKFANTVSGNLQKSLDESKRVKDELDKLQAESKKLGDDLRNQIKGKQGELELIQKQFADAKTQATVDLSKYQKQIDDLKKDLADAGVAKEKVMKDGEQQMNALQTVINRHEKTIKELRANLDKYIRESPTLKIDVIALERPKGRVISVDPTNGMVFINLGAADNARPGLTFSVYAQGPDGKGVKHIKTGPDGRPVLDDGKPVEVGKATIEVVDVVADHRSRARVTSVRLPLSRDRPLVSSADPIQAGDLLYNPGWDPNLRQRVAIAGLVDYTGETRSEGAEAQMRVLREFIRTLENQNLIVDAYIDLKDQKIKGELTRQTDFLILGDTPEAGGRENDPRTERATKIGTMIDTMLKDADVKAVSKISLRKFLAMSGVRPPRSNESGAASYNLRPPATTGGAAGKEPAKEAPKEAPKEDAPKEPAKEGEAEKK